MAADRRLNILVAGGAGFIGSNLCDRLVQKGHRVTCLDNFSTSHISNVRPLLNHPQFRLMEHDVRDPLALRDRVDRIYNLACPASPRHYQRDPVGTMRTCVLGALNMLELAKQKSAIVLQASTSEVYGDPEIHPQPEDYVGHVNATGPRACYDEGKRAAETLFFDFHRVHKVSIKVARIFNTYGPRMLENDGRVVSNFIVQALHNDTITLYGDGSQTRSFCYVDDLLNGLELLMESRPEITGPCNLGNPHEVSVKEVAQLIIEQTGSRSTLSCLELPQDDPKRRRPVIKKALDLLGWKPQVPLERGLRATIDYFALRINTPDYEGTPIAARVHAQNRKRSARAALGELASVNRIH